MTVTTIMNGSMKLILTPTTELERSILAEIFRGPVDATSVSTMQIGDSNHANCVIISPKQSEK